MSSPLDLPGGDAFTFDCQGETLVAVLHRPMVNTAKNAAEIGVIVIVGGPQYRAGSHRQFVQLGRALAAAGLPVMRFDVRGMGDSTGALRSFEHITPDVSAAVDAFLFRVPSVKRVVLWGLCDGASAALLYLHERSDDRVRGLCLLNPWVRSEASQAKTRLKHYYTRRLRQWDFWVKLLSGRVAHDAAAQLLRSVGIARKRQNGDAPALSFQGKMLAAMNSADASVLVLLSGDDYTAREFEEFVSMDRQWREALERPNVRIETLQAADHTLSRAEDGRRAIQLTLDWIGAMPAARGLKAEVAAVQRSC